MKKIISSRTFAYIVGLTLFFVLWELLSTGIGEKTMILPDPIGTLKKTGELLQAEYTYRCLGNSLLRLCEGFLLAVVAALLLGIPAGNCPFFRRMLTPAMTILKAIPTACFVFLFLVLIGAKNAPVLLVVLIALPVLYESVVDGIVRIDGNVVRAMKIDSGTFWNNLLRIQIPLMLPSFVVGVSGSFALSFKIEIMAEVLTGSTTGGIGSAILGAQKNDPSDLVPVFAYSLIAVATILIITAVFEGIENRFKKKTVR